MIRAILEHTLVGPNMRILASFCLLILPGLVLAADEEPKADERLQQLLKRFPAADANRDGVLTRAEAQAYREKKQGDPKNRVTRKQDTTPDAILPTFADVHYGEHERNVLDFYQARSDKPTPLVIYIHGGGFVGGNKKVAPAQLNGFLDSGISVAAILRTGMDELQIENVFVYTPDAKGRNVNAEMLEFFQKQFAKVQQ